MRLKGALASDILQIPAHFDPDEGIRRDMQASVGEVHPLLKWMEMIQ